MSVSPVLLEIDQATQFVVTEDQEKAILTLPKMWSEKPTKCLILDD
jgi:hypothetical protein